MLTLDEIKAMKPRDGKQARQDGRMIEVMVPLPREVYDYLAEAHPSEVEYTIAELCIETMKADQEPPLTASW
jgi:hypothetical protein